jgi:hypothetical protein
MMQCTTCLLAMLLLLLIKLFIVLQVRRALGSKVSRERIGTELEGMFNGA